MLVTENRYNLISSSENVILEEALKFARKDLSLLNSKEKIELYISYEKRFTNEHLKSLSQLNINKLYLLSCEKITRLNYLPLSIVELEVRECGIKDIDLTYLPRTLTKLDVRNCEKITAQALKLLPPFIKKLGINQITDLSLNYLTESKIEELEISESKNVSDEGLKHLSHSIKALNVSQCKITDKCLYYLSRFPNLTSLNISRCNEITGKGLKHLRAIELNSLNLNFCEKITDTCLNCLSQFPSLTDLVLSDTITDNGIKYLSPLLKLTRLDLSGNKNITKTGLRSLSQLNLLQSLWCIKTAKEEELNYFPQLTNKINFGDQWHLVKNWVQALDNNESI